MTVKDTWRVCSVVALIALALFAERSGVMSTNTASHYVAYLCGMLAGLWLASA